MQHHHGTLETLPVEVFGKHELWAPKRHCACVDDESVSARTLDAQKMQRVRGDFRKLTTRHGSLN